MKKEKITHKEQLKNCCIKIGNNKQLSYLVQTKMFELGGIWFEGQDTFIENAKGYIKVYSYSTIFYGYKNDSEEIKPSQLGIKKWMYKEKSAFKYICKKLGSEYVITNLKFNKDQASFNISSIPHRLRLSFKDGSIKPEIVEQIAMLITNSINRVKDSRIKSKKENTKSGYFIDNMACIFDVNGVSDILDNSNVFRTENRLCPLLLKLNCLI